MARSGTFNFQDFERIRNNLEKLNQEQVDIFIDACAKELAARLLAKVIKRTPVGDYPNSSGKKGGTLRRGWTGGKNSSAVAYADSLTIHHFGDAYVIEIVNPVEYASYVEFGHRTRNHKGWVNGRFMLTISEQEIQQAAPAIIEKKLMKQMGELFT
jgi:hypothetical protein|nr:MAG TPA: type I neck protein [Caudoviricetes sp.]